MTLLGQDVVWNANAFRTSGLSKTSRGQDCVGCWAGAAPTERVCETLVISYLHGQNAFWQVGQMVKVS